MSLLILLTFILTPELPAQEPTVKVLTIDDRMINGVTEQYIVEGIGLAQKEKAECLIIQLDTPGGMLESTRKIIKAMLNSQVPIVVYVAPSGARAGSAGVFITLASNIAAMAPSTNIGAAHPVMMGPGGAPQQEERPEQKKRRSKRAAFDKTQSQILNEKVLNDTIAWVSGIAKTRGRNIEWAKKAVLESVSITEEEALKQKVIDIVAKDINELLEKINKQKVETAKGTVVLRTKGARLDYIELTWRQKILDILANPTLAFILFMLGFYGLLYEVTHPGFGVPGVAGLICIICAFFAFQVLPTNYAGLALIGLGLIFFIAEVMVPTFGLFTAGGIIAIVLGSLILFKSPFEFFRVSLFVVIPVAIATGLITVFLTSVVIKVHRKKAISGKEGLIGQEAEAIANINDKEGKVFIHGEIWKAISDEPIKKGKKVTVVEIKGLVLKVKEA